MYSWSTSIVAISLFAIVHYSDHVRSSLTSLKHRSLAAQQLHKAMLQNVQDALQATQRTMLSLQDVQTTTGFLFAGCESCTCDICTFVSLFGCFAPVETRIFEFILQHEQGCSGGEEPGLVIDVGANAGYFTVHAASLGCKVVAFEPNPGPAAFLQLNAQLNHFQGHVKHYNMAVGASNATGTRINTDTVWGFGAVQVVEEGTPAPEETLAIVPLGEVVKSDAVLLKIDTEGYESHVLEGAMNYLAGHNVANIVVEVKSLNSKLGMLKDVMKAARLPHAYTYAEQYGESLSVVQDLKGRVWDITDRLHKGLELYCCEDIWLRKEPLPSEFLAE